MTVLAQTAEWQCTRCGSTNRKLVPSTSDEATDRCVYCRTKHHLEPGETTVRWLARAS
jgi:DNA-directed RNA polymerase subunit RPC12/RpoP